MATIPSKPQGKFKADCDHFTLQCSYCDERLCIKFPEAEGFSYIYITREQAMAFFDLVPRYNPNEEMNPPVKPESKCPTCNRFLEFCDC